MIDLLIYIIAPLTISNICHIVIVKKNLFAYLTVPVSEPLFGRNKTWRGFVIVPLLNAFAFSLICFLKPCFPIFRAFITGFFFGVVYLLFELPNSYLKRRLGIMPGGKAENHPWLFMLLDKTDSSLGVSLFYFLLHPDLVKALQLFFLSVFTHVFFSWILVTAGLKKSF